MDDDDRADDDLQLSGCSSSMSAASHTSALGVGGTDGHRNVDTSGENRSRRFAATDACTVGKRRGVAFRSECNNGSDGAGRFGDLRQRAHYNDHGVISLDGKLNRSNNNRNGRKYDDMSFAAFTNKHGNVSSRNGTPHDTFPERGHPHFIGDDSRDTDFDFGRDSPNFENSFQHNDVIEKYARKIEKLKKKIYEVLSENEELHREHKRLLDTGRTKEDWEELQELTNTLVQENKLLINKDESNQREIGKMERQIAKQTEEIVHLKTSISSQDAQLQKLATDTSYLKEENSRLHRENARLKADSEFSSQPLQRKSREDQRNIDQRDRILQDMTNEHIQEVAQLRDRIQNLELVITKKDRQMVQSESRLQEACALVSSLKHRLEAVNKEKNRLSERLAEVELNYEAAMQERTQFLAHLDSVVQVAERRKLQLENLMQATVVSKEERDRALMEAAKRDAKLETISRQLHLEQQQAKEQLLNAVDMIRLQRLKYKQSHDRQL